MVGWMTGKERMLAALHFEEPDMVPVGPYMSTLWSPKVMGKMMSDYTLGDEKTRVEITVGSHTRLGLDWVWVGLGPERGWREKLKVEDRGADYLVTDKTTGATRVIPKDDVPYWPAGTARAEVKASMEILRRRREEADWKAMISNGQLDEPLAVKRLMGHDTLIVGLVGMPPSYWADRLGIPDWVKLMYRQPQEAEKGLEYALSLYMEAAKAVAQIGVDAFYSEDWGNSVDVLSPGLFRRFVAPYERRMVDYLKSFGVPVIYRTCGHIKPVIDDIVRYGADAYHFEGTMKGLSFEISEMKEAVRDRGNACLVAPFDVMHVVREGNPAVIENEVRRIVDMAAEGGGLILGTNVPMMKDVSVTAMETMVKAARKWGRYPMASGQAR